MKTICNCGHHEDDHGDGNPSGRGGLHDNESCRFCGCPGFTPEDDKEEDEDVEAARSENPYNESLCGNPLIVGLDLAAMGNPIRSFDYHAYRDPEGMCGYGATKAEAVADLTARERDNA